jgi:O-antigen/teichoic acid export membrane protein
VLKNIGSNWSLIAITVAASYITTPLVIRLLGAEGYGTWTLITAMTGHMALLALGVPMACVRYLAQHVTEGDEQKVNETIGTCAGLYLMLGAAAVAIGAVLGMAFLVYDIPLDIRWEASFAFATMVIYVALSFIGLLPEGIFFAHHDFVRRNLIRIVGVLLRAGLTIGLLSMRPSLLLLAAIQLSGLLFDFSVSYLLIRRRYPRLRIRLDDFNRTTLRRILSFSLYVLLLGAGTRLSFETNALVIGGLLGVAIIPAYVVANSLIVYLIDFIVGIAAVVSPMATTLVTSGRSAELKELFLKWSKAALSLTIAAGAFLMVLGPRFIGWWIGPEYEASSGPVLQILMASSFVFLPARGVAWPILTGLGEVKIPAFAFLAAGLLNLGLSLMLARPFGLVGVAIGTAVPNVLFAIGLIALACRALNLTLGEYARYVIPRAALGALPVIALLLWFKVGWQVQGLGGLVAAGSTMVLVFGAIWILFVYRDDPYVDMKAPLGRLRAWSRA